MATAWNTWLRVHTPRPRARIRLVCFPHAGGAASAFRDWGALLPAAIEVAVVQYPGRQDRFGDPLPQSVAELAERTAAAVGERLDRPTAFFGHSMGATVAFEAARLLQPRFPTPLVRLFASARKAPADCRPNGLRLDDDEVKELVRRLGGEGAALLENEELSRLVLPVLRHDLRMVESYRHVPGAPLTCPITAIVGKDDSSVTRADAERWSACTMAACRVRELDGGHFYFEKSPRDVMGLLVEGLLSAEAAHA
ncbi:alpha/beta fold hydrolase [Streptomyces phaeochromogenes]|uniref:thioesterase II family protein n=1 Tax=Streptomyces phaeochromogenes TaxID=1923 RepID=UPI003405316A